MKNVVKLNTYFPPWELEQEIDKFVEYYNVQRVYESLKNMNLADVFFRRDRGIQTAIDLIKSMTLNRKRLTNMGSHTLE